MTDAETLLDLNNVATMLRRGMEANLHAMQARLDAGVPANEVALFEARIALAERNIAAMTRMSELAAEGQRILQSHRS